MINFPHITHLDDVIREFEGRKDFAILDRGSYRVIDYLYTDKDTFETPILKEGRGLKFDRAGNVIARPFQKFFNLNEREETRAENFNWGSRILVMDKLDGSMIHPALVDGELLFMTRKGHTDVAQQAMDEVSYNPDEMIQFLRRGITPIYEYVSPNNRIVLRYQEPALRLLAYRDMRTGQYLGTPFGKVVDQLDPEQYVETVRAMQGEEGVVLRFLDTNQMVKIKADEYVQLHKAFDLFSSPKKVYEAIINDNVDDIIPLLSENDAVVLSDHRDQFVAAVNKHATAAQTFVEGFSHFTQKDFALKVQECVDPRLQGAYFQIRAEKSSPYDAIKATIARRLSTEGEIDRHKDLLE